ncbi:MAG: hypothetical protein AAF460_04510 [Pseudomonadota bacterium]
MRCRGGVAVLVLALLGLLSLASLVAWQGRPQAVHDDGVTQRLMQARSALIEYAVSYPQNYHSASSGPGKFPCPDSNGDGNSGPRCPALAVGLLPRDFATSLGAIQELQRETSTATEPLWWVVAAAHRNRPAPSGSPSHAMVLNSDTVPLLTLDYRDDVIGLVIAPGPALAGQTRASGTLRLEDYLEGENADGDADFSRSAGNDRVVAIRWHDVMPLVERQAVAAVRAAVLRYHGDHGRFPYLGKLDALDSAGDLPCSNCQVRGWVAVQRYRAGAGAVSHQHCADALGAAALQPAVDMPAWVVRNFWHTRVWLHLADAGCGAPPQVDGQAVHAVFVGVGPPLDDPPSGVRQSRSVVALEHYLDHTANTDGDHRYTRLTGGNDTWLIALQGAP